MEIIFKQFGAFIKRSMLPASVLLLFLSLLLYKENKLTIIFDNFHLSGNNLYLEGFTLLTLLISLSYFMSICTQFIFDNQMKKNFHSYFFYKEENFLLTSLREKSTEKLKKENSQFDNIPLTDYILYQILGRKLQFLEKETNTKRYIDEIKSSGSIFIALILAFFIQMVIHLLTGENIFINILIGCLFIGVILFVAIEYLRSKYRSRSIRIYVNYLIGDNDN